MNHIIEVSSDSTGLANTGMNEQKLTSHTVRWDFAALDQEFATAADAKDKTNWVADIADKKIYPMFLTEEMEISDVEDTYKEGNSKYRIKVGPKIRKFKVPCGALGHQKLSTFHNQTLRVYEHCNEGELKAVTEDGIKVRGQKVRIEVNKHVDATIDNYEYTPVTLYYSDYKEFEKNPVVIFPDFSYSDILGIFDAKIAIVGTPTSSSIKFTVSTGDDWDEPVTSLAKADIPIKTSVGGAITYSFVAADANGVYEITGSSVFANGNVLDLNGVVTKTELSYESTGAVTISGIS